MGSDSSFQSRGSSKMPSAMSAAVAAPPKASRNVLNVVLGDIVFKTWYPSFYPEELVGKEIERLYVCPWCFKYTKDVKPFLAHFVCLEASVQIHLICLQVYGRTCAVSKARILPEG